MQIMVNEVDHEVDDKPARSLLVVLREELGLLAAKYGCGEGACGACTVLMDGHAVRSCVLPADEVGPRAVTTLEGLAADAVSGRLAAAFATHGASQCGYCTPGMLVSATALLRANPEPSTSAIVTAMDGNLCRCGCYRRILDAIAGAALSEAPARGEALARARAHTATDAPVPATESASTGSLSVPMGPSRPWDLTPTADRDWFTVLGDGLVVVFEPREVERALRSTGRGWSTPGGAWIHVGGDGRVRAFTGKVDLGQHNTAALARLVAAELGMGDHESVEVVAGDTDICPEDMGTFGSRSMADAGTLLSATARATREALIGLAAVAWEASPADLVLTDGAVVTRDGARRASVGELVSGRTTVEAVRWDRGGGLRPLPPGKGSPAVSQDAEYSSDLSLPGMLHARILRPPVVGAELRSVDTSAAASIAGVRVVEEGDFVAVLAADPTTAADALDAVDATWSVPTNRPSESDIDEWLRAHPTEVKGWDGGLDESDGDVEAGLGGSVQDAGGHLPHGVHRARPAGDACRPGAVGRLRSGDGVDGHPATIWRSGAAGPGTRRQPADGARHRSAHRQRVRRQALG